MNQHRTYLCANCFPFHGVENLDDANRRYDDERLRLQQRQLPMTNPFARCTHFRFLIAIPELHVSCFPLVIQGRLDCCGTLVATVIGVAGPVYAFVPVLTVPTVRFFDVGCDEREIQETNLDDSAMVVDSDVEYLSELI